MASMVSKKSKNGSKVILNRLQTGWSLARPARHTSRAEGGASTKCRYSENRRERCSNLRFGFPKAPITGLQETRINAKTRLSPFAWGHGGGLWISCWKGFGKRFGSKLNSFLDYFGIGRCCFLGIFGNETESRRTSRRIQNNKKIIRRS